MKLFLSPMITFACFAWVFASQASAEPGKASAANGAMLFKQRCSVCHSVVSPPPPGVGPNLAGVVNRKAAATEFKYSNALRAFGQIWTPESIDRFLVAPGAMVPGTFMVIVVPKPDERRDIVAYLATTKGDQAAK